jgi:hypothetical protein
MLMAFPDPATRSRVLENVLSKSRGIMIPVFVGIYAISDDCRKNEHESQWLAPVDRLPELKCILQSQLKKFRDSPLLRDAPSVGAALRAWEISDGQADASIWIREQLRSESGCLQILRSAAGYQISGDWWQYTQIIVEWLCKFITPEELDAAVGRIVWERCDDHDKELKKLFEQGKRRIQQPPSEKSVSDVTDS